MVWMVVVMLLGAARSTSPGGRRSVHHRRAHYWRCVRRCGRRRHHHRKRRDRGRRNNHTNISTLAVVLLRLLRRERHRRGVGVAPPFRSSSVFLLRFGCLSLFVFWARCGGAGGGRRRRRHAQGGLHRGNGDVLHRKHRCRRQRGFQCLIASMADPVVRHGPERSSLTLPTLVVAAVVVAVVVMMLRVFAFEKALKKGLEILVTLVHTGPRDDPVVVVVVVAAHHFLRPQPWSSWCCWCYFCYHISSLLSASCCVAPRS